MVLLPWTALIVSPRSRTQSPRFKARVAMEVISGRMTIQDIAAVVLADEAHHLSYGEQWLRERAASVARAVHPCAMQRHWIPAMAFAVAWLLVVGAMRLSPPLAEEP